MQARVDRETGTVTLPEELWSYFGEDEFVDVSQYRDHLALWKRWSRRAGGGETLVKVSRKDAFARAAGRFAEAVELLRVPAPEVALYLSGYVVECWLKVLFCVARHVDNLDEATRRFNRERGSHYDFLGADGHDLPLLWEVTGLRAYGEVVPKAQLILALGWSASWRYNVPQEISSQPSAYWAAVGQVTQFLLRHRER